MKKITIILLASLISINLFSTENMLITGRLIDTKTDEALTYALITILDSENNLESICMSNDNGEFTLKYNPNSISYSGPCWATILAHTGPPFWRILGHFI